MCLQSATAGSSFVSLSSSSGCSKDEDCAMQTIIEGVNGSTVETPVRVARAAGTVPLCTRSITESTAILSVSHSALLPDALSIQCTN